MLGLLSPMSCYASAASSLIVRQSPYGALRMRSEGMPSARPESGEPG